MESPIRFEYPPGDSQPELWMKKQLELLEAILDNLIVPQVFLVHSINVTIPWQWTDHQPFLAVVEDGVNLRVLTFIKNVPSTVDTDSDIWHLTEDGVLYSEIGSTNIVSIQPIIGA